MTKLKIYRRQRRVNHGTKQLVSVAVTRATIPVTMLSLSTILFNREFCAVLVTVVMFVSMGVSVMMSVTVG